MSSSIADFDAALPYDVRHLVETILHEPLLSADQVLCEVNSYTDRVRGEAAQNEHVDLPMAERIACSCRKLLELHEGFDNSQRRIVQAACRYFVLENDAESDLAPMGFDDDAEVMNAAVTTLGCDELYIVLA